MTAVKDPKVLEILRGVRCDGDLATIPSQLDPKMYAKVNNVLSTLGGKWNRKRAGHVFPGDACVALAAVMETGSYRDPVKEDNFYPTPIELVHKMLEFSGVRKGDRVLEPSAGKGNIVRPLMALGAIVEAVEINPDFRSELIQAGALVVIDDFLKQDPRSYRMFDAVLMNPPFAVEGRPQADIEHVRHAYDFLMPGGVLVAIMSPGFIFRTNAFSVEFRQFVQHYGQWDKNPSGSFKAAGTHVETVMVTLRAVS